MRITILLLLMAIGGLPLIAQTTFPVNGVADPRTKTFAFTHATIYKDGVNPTTNATMVIREGNIESVGANVTIPKDAVVIDCNGKYIYPSFIDIYSDYGMPATPPCARRI